MTEPERIATLLAALERRWREQADLPLGEVIVDGLEPLGLTPELLGGVKDSQLLEALGSGPKPRFAPQEPGLPDMRDPQRIALLLAAIEREWRGAPDLSLGRVLVDALDMESVGPEHLELVEDFRLLEGLGVETEDEARFVREEPVQARERAKAWLRGLPKGEAARIRPVAELFVGGTDRLLLFAPVELALEVAMIHEALEEPTTWGEARAALSVKRFAELVEWTYGPGDPADHEKLELPEPWPQLRYHDIPAWLPPSVAGRFGQRFDSMLDSGTNFEREIVDLMIEALERAGVTVRFDGPDLEGQFELM